MPEEKRPPVCDYEGSDYQSRFWEKGGRAYEDGCEALALRKLLPPKGNLLLELGAGAGRNTLRYAGFGYVVLLDYSRTQLQLARQKLGNSDRYTYVAADIYRLPFIDGLFDSATMIRVLHHMADAPAALEQVRNVLAPEASFILEYANKRNLKAILRYALHKQSWSPYTQEPVEFAPLNFDFHPRAVVAWLARLGFRVESTRTVSHFRIGFLKRIIPTRLLIWLDALLQWSGDIVQLTPSVFIRSRLVSKQEPTTPPADILAYFKCPACNHHPLVGHANSLECPACGKHWPIEDGIFNFKD